MTILDTLPDAVFFLDETEAIVYMNAQAQTIIEATPQDVLGKSFWRSVPQLVCTSLYQAMLKMKQTQTPTEVQYISPVTQAWLHVYLSPTIGGLTLQFHTMDIFARHQEMVPQRESLYMEVLENMHAGIILLTPEGIILDLNEVLLADAHIRREEVVGRPLIESPWWSSSPDRQQLHAAIAQASTGKTMHFEVLVHPREGMDLHLEIAITPRLDMEHHIEYLVLAGIDITARKHAEAEIHALIDTIPQLVWTGQPDGYVDAYNQSWCDYTGLSADEARGDEWIQCTHPDDRQRVLSVWQRALQSGGVYETEQRLRQGTTGAYRWFLMQVVPHKDVHGTILKYIGICTDIEERKRAEQQLKTSEENWRVLAETVPQLVWMARANGVYEYANQRWRDYTGFTLEHTHNDKWLSLQFIHPDDQESTQTLWRHAMETGDMFEHEERLKHAQTGEYRWFLTRAIPVRDEAGQIVMWFGTATDIEEQKRIEEALRQSQEHIRALIGSNIIGIIFVEGEEDVLVEANDAWLHMTGYTREDLNSRTLTRMKVISPEQTPLFERATQEVVTCGQHTPFETELVCKDGSRLPILQGGVLFQEQPRQMIGFALDNSARKELEQRKDAFISMASHELRNPLTALKLQTTLLHRQLSRQGMLDQAPALSSMETQIKKVTRLVEELLDVSKIQAGRVEYRQEMVDLDALLREIVDTMQQIKTTHRILIHGIVGISFIGDQDRLGQVFTNLLSNAIKYSPGAETVEVELSASDEAITIRVLDHGLGIPRELCDKIFDRFYRVAGPQQKAIPGLGMGLYIVAEIVKHHGGTIAVESNVGKGSAFTVTLPTRKEA
ncbi:hypothetical protein KSC_022940 [Ktedonobacter sp. SOSP1-52]|nr:hypothetical protein KSC_022940 [Ktedonobacter sp. SOSP1-52]